MKKIAAGLLAIMLLTGCSNNNNEQTLFVENSKEKYALVDLEGESKTKFIYDKYETVGNSGFIVVQDDKYGYILRFEEDKANITGIANEPWHFRYVGKEAAREIFNNGWTLEEYCLNKGIIPDIQKGQ